MPFQAAPYGAHVGFAQHSAGYTGTGVRIFRAPAVRRKNTAHTRVHSRRIYMTEFMLTLEHGLSQLIELSIHVLEFMGVATILMGAFRAVYEICRRQPGVRLKLAKSMALALEFKLGGEILRTVQVRDWSEIAIVGAIILLRGVLNLLIHHEIKIEEDRDERMKALMTGEVAHTQHAPQASACVLYSPDPAVLARWYCEALGASARKADGIWLLSRDGLEIALREGDVTGEGCFIVDDPEALQREFMAKGVRIPRALEDGAFTAIDADGHNLRFIARQGK